MCIVPFCRKDCPLLPDEAVVFRADGRYVCESCGRELQDHKHYAYPTGMNHCVLGCDGVFYHL